jgi:hypothetical protein
MWSILTSASGRMAILLGGKNMDDAFDRASLRGEYMRLKLIYSEAVEHLFAAGYRVTDAEYRRLKNAVDEARVQAEIASLKLQERDTPVHSKAS